MSNAPPLKSDEQVIQSVLDHIDGRSTDITEETWREPVANYLDPARYDAELALLRRYPIPFCPSLVLDKPGAYLAREAAGTPLLAVRGADGVARVFKNACRHRGMQVAEGCGHAGGFMCPYHGWSYGLDGGLVNVPHDAGFPDLDKATRGLVPVHATEHAGLVFVTQEPGQFGDDVLAAIPDMIPADEHLHLHDVAEVEANWKVLMEGFLEGYHIKPTHKDSFFPHGFDNLNIVERFGRNNRVVFPFRAIEKFRDPGRTRSADRVLSYNNHLFPNAMVITFPDMLVSLVLEPIAIDRTRVHSWAMNGRALKNAENPHATEGAMQFLDAGVLEDRAMARSIQRSLGSGANEFFEFGKFEGALTHFHRSLGTALGRLD
jgi:phenylpropionate dioxygenase-like ring-hydroxylating dioxygenase large terminal subunit